MKQYEQQINRIALKFTKKFFKEQFGEKANQNDYRIIGNLNIGLGPIVINDTYHFDINWVVCTLNNNWSTDIIRAYYDEMIETTNEGKIILNFYNYGLRKYYEKKI